MIKLIQDSFYTYAILLIRPFKTHAEFRRFRQIRQSGEGVYSFDRGSDRFNIVPLTKEQAICFSWIMEILNAIYSVISINLGISAFNYLKVGNSINNWLALKLYYSGQVSTITMSIVMVVLFPLTAWVYIKVWEVIVVFFMKLFEYDESEEEGASEVVSSTLSSSLFLLIPIFGSSVAKLAQILLFFAGLRSNLGMNIQQSILVLMAPIFLFVLLSLFMIGYMVLMFTAI